jgi:DNA-binding PadR family transcriptional regulator
MDSSMTLPAPWRAHWRRSARTWMAHDDGEDFREHRHGRGHGRGGEGFGRRSFPGPFAPAGSFGPGFGPGGFGPGMGGPGFGRRGRRARRGDVRAAALLLLAEEPRNGYQIIQEIAQRSGEVWRPSPGSVYPVLQQLEDEGLVSVDSGQGGKIYALTPAGTEYVREHRGELGSPWDSAADTVPGEVWELFGLARQVFGAVGQVAQAGSPAQHAEAARLLTETRRSLYRVLAQDDPGETDGPAAQN